jgi:hypothetical protein
MQYYRQKALEIQAILLKGTINPKALTITCGGCGKGFTLRRGFLKFYFRFILF